jgi:hypothetical protein
LSDAQHAGAILIHGILIWTGWKSACRAATLHVWWYWSTPATLQVTSATLYITLQPYRYPPQSNR